MNDRMMEILFDVHSGLPRQGPGDDDSTRRALQLCSPPDIRNVLDVGCGPGAQTVVLAEELPLAEVTAVDVHQPYLDELAQRVKARGVDNRIRTLNHDMSALPFDDDTFDLIWAEGSAYIMGVPNALNQWRRLLRDNGWMVLTELVWLNESPSDQVADFFGEEYPAMKTIDGNLEVFANAGYEVVKHFVLPDSSWWDEYYGPLSRKLDKDLQTKYADDDIGSEIVKMTQLELEFRKTYPDEYGYVFCVAKVSR